MKIVYLPGYRYLGSLDEPLTSGDLRYSFTLSRALVRIGHEVHVITRLDDGDPTAATLDGVSIHRYRGALTKVFGTSFDISLRRSRLFKKLSKDADLIICNSPLSLEHLQKIDIPLIYIASGLEDVKNYSFSPKEIIGFLAIKLLRDPLKRLTWKKAMLVNTTAWHEDTTLLKWGIPKEKIGTISSSIDTSRFSPQKNAANIIKKRHGIAQSHDIILSVSRFTPAKAVIETIQAYNKLDRPDTALVLIGVHHSHSSTYYENILREIKQSPRKKSIHLLENIAEHELPLYYSSATVTSVFSKGYDPLPTTIIEAMACGSPVVSTYYGTREQFIEDRTTGLFVEEKNTSDWVAKVSELLDNDETREQIVSNALRHVKKHFDSIEIAKQYIKAIKT